MTINGPVIPKRYLLTSVASPTPSASSPQFTTGEIVTCLRTGRSWIVGNDGTNPKMNPIRPEFSHVDGFSQESKSGIDGKTVGTFPFTGAGIQIYGSSIDMCQTKDGATSGFLNCGTINASNFVNAAGITVNGSGYWSISNSSPVAALGNIVISGGKVTLNNNLATNQYFFGPVENYGVETGVSVSGGAYSIICNMSNTKCDMRRIVEANSGINIPSIISANAIGTNGLGTIIAINPSNRVFLESEMNATGNLTASNNGTGTSTTYGSTGNSVYQTIGTHSTGTTSTGRAAIGTATITSVILGQGATECTAVVKLSQLSSSAQTFVYRFGFLDNLDGGVADGVYFEYTDVGGASATPNWMAHSYANSVGIAATDTTIAASAVNWVKLRISVNSAATRADYYINDSLVATRTSNIPNGASQITGFYSVLRKTNGTTTHLAQVDYMGMVMEVAR